MATSKGMVGLGLAVMEKLSTLLLHAVAGSHLHDYSASCVIEFNKHSIPNTRKEQQFFQKKLCHALEELATFIRYHYPNILQKAYIINFYDDYLASLDIDESLLKHTVLLKSPEGLARYLGSQVPPRYGGGGESFAESDFLHLHCPTRNPVPTTSIIAPEISSGAHIELEDTKVKDETIPSSIDTSCKGPENSETEKKAPRLIYSETIGSPSIMFEPDDLQTAHDLCPDKMGARVVFADSDTVVKFGPSVHLGEAEALHLASTRTTIATPTLLSAYILDDVGYIVMSFEAGEPLEQYWERVSEAEQNRILDTLRDYVNQMRGISGEFIGGLDRSPCRDGIFDAGYGDYSRYRYGPYQSEESFNEGIIQALRDRLPPEVLNHEHDIESNFWNGEYMLYQTVRGLKNHRIVFTHADLHPGNIIVRTDGTVVLLDWGLAGFWPEYWEFYRAMHTPHWRASWDRMVEKFIPPFYVEYGVIKKVFATVWN